jgi:hypothetical protein
VINLYAAIKQNHLIKVVKFSASSGSKGCGGGSFQLGGAERCSFTRSLSLALPSPAPETMYMKKERARVAMILVTKHVARVEEHLEHRRRLQQTDDSARRRVHGEREMHRPRLAYYKFSSRRASIGRRSNFNDARAALFHRHLILSLSLTFTRCFRAAADLMTLSGTARALVPPMNNVCVCTKSG